MRMWLGVVACWACTACAHRPHAELAAGAPARTDAALPPLAWIDATPITEADFDVASRSRLRRLQDDAALEEYLLVWAAVEDAISTRTLADEARRRQISLGTLLHREVDARLGPPNEADVFGLYESKRDLIPLPYQEAAPMLRQQVQRERAQALRRALADGIRERRQVRYNMPPPSLHRVDVRAAGPALGPEGAAVTLVVYSDFTCPYSAQARRTLQALRARYPTSLRVVYHDAPMGPDPMAQLSAQAAHCAWEQHQFWPFYDVLFEHAGKLRAQDLSTYARQASLDTVQFERCLASDRPRLGVSQRQTEAQALGVTATPAMWLNGMRLTGVLPLPLMQAFVDAELFRTRPHGATKPFAARSTP